MTDVEQELLAALRELERRIETMRTAGAPADLLPLFSRLDALTNALPDGTSPDLLHYLHKKSYQKARLWLEGRDSENRRGRCGR